MWVGVLLCAAAGAYAETFDALRKELEAARTWDRDRLAREVFRPDALLMASDATPGDVVWRRTSALLAHLRTLPDAPGLEAEADALAALKPVAHESETAQRAREYSRYTADLGSTGTEALRFIGIALAGDRAKLKSLTGTLPLYR